MDDHRKRIPLAVRIAAWLMLVVTVAAVVPPLYATIIANHGDTLLMMLSAETRVDGFGSKLPYLIYWVLCLAAGVLPAVFTLRGSLLAYGIAVTVMGWLAWDYIQSIPLNGWPDALGLLTILIAVLLATGAPAYFRRVRARMGARGGDASSR